VKLEQTIIIDRPIEEVFAYRTALQRTAEWQRDVIATDLLSDGPTALGSHGTEQRRGQSDVASEWALQVTEFELNRVLGIVTSCGDIQVRERDVMASDEGNTRYTVCLEMTGSPLPNAAFHKKAIDALITLKERVEGRKAGMLAKAPEGAA
jgi:hypothetical protein